MAGLAGLARKPTGVSGPRCRRTSDRTAHRRAARSGSSVTATSISRLLLHPFRHRRGRSLRDGHGLEPGDIAEAAIRVRPQHARACNIAEPTDGYGVKVSIRHLVAMALAGEAVGDPRSTRRRQRPGPIWWTCANGYGSSVMPGVPTRWAARIEVATTDGRMLALDEDVGVPGDDLALQETRLLNNFHTLADPALGPDDASALACGALGMADARDPAALFRLSRTAA